MRLLRGIVDASAGRRTIRCTMKQATAICHQNAFLRICHRRPDRLLVLLLFLLRPSALARFSVAVASSEDVPEQLSEYIPFDASTDGHANLREGSRLFQLKRYNEASAFLWRAVLLKERAGDQYTVDEAFTPFLQCYLLENKIVDGLVFISAESFSRGQNQMGEMYLKQALERDARHEGAIRLKELMHVGVGAAIDGRDTGLESELVQTQRRLTKLGQIRDSVDLSKSRSKRKKTTLGNSDDAFWEQFKENNGAAKAKQENDDMVDKSPEDIYNIATYYFNNKNLTYASELFELSCQKSNAKLSPACTNAVYLRTNLCDWGEEGKGFEKDMDIIVQITKAETEMYRFVTIANEELKRQNGLNDKMDLEEGVIQWKRATSVHPHMMLGYPLDNKDVILKRHVAESMASLDEIRARLDDDGTIRDRPNDLPYNVEEMRRKFAKRHGMQLGEGKRSNSSVLPEPIRVGFVGCGFNSKAVMYLSQDMFRFFDPSVVEVHIFSSGAPDHPLFINGAMRGVDWRQRVIDNVDYFHDVRQFKEDHIGLARFIHEKEIQILIEWDGYARQGERASGLMALRPCPVQILHQEFLMTSGAQYIDYIITDKVVSPLRLDHLYTEKFLYLPNHFFSKGHAVQKEVTPPSFDYVPKANGTQFQLGIGSPQENACLASNPLGSKAAEMEVSFVYCNFNKFLKHNPETMRSWIRILQRVPNSLLCLLENPKEGIPNLRKFVTEVTARTDPEMDLNARIHFLPWEQNPFDHQRRSHALCNVMLDSHPYNGHTTAQDALYAGVPIVSRSDGDDMSSRVSTSANKVLGLAELNAKGVNHYEDIAIRLGTDGPWFNSIRTKLIKTCLQRNPLHAYWDVPRYVKNFERGLSLAWEAFMDGRPPHHIEVLEDGEDINGTSDVELIAREFKRKERKTNRVVDGRSMNSEL
eukprot:CCRYP_000736-RC/>CCRYP_000736-RC protein AED:0.03 eAED:0.03 QI:41/1/1/1/1/1/3/486/927